MGERDDALLQAALDKAVAAFDGLRGIGEDVTAILAIAELKLKAEEASEDSRASTRLSLAEAMRAQRRQRTCFLDAGLFGEPAWDMLLTLYINQARNERTATSTLCSASGVPNSTAHRYITLLEFQGLVTRHRDELDSRLNLVKLSERATAALDDYLGSLFASNHITP